MVITRMVLFESFFLTKPYNFLLTKLKKHFQQIVCFSVRGVWEKVSRGEADTSYRLVSEAPPALN